MIGGTKEQKIERFEKMSLDQLVLAASVEAALKKNAETEETLIRGVILQKMLKDGFIEGQAYVRDDGIGATIQTKETKTIQVTKLLLAGVSQETINGATDKKISKPFVTIRVPKQKGDEDDEE